jgi:hypothetical protein
MVYLLIVILLMASLPIGSILIEILLLKDSADVVLLVGRWFVFWAVGVRQFLAGLRQALLPEFTSEGIFGIKSKDPLPIVQELGFANLSMGVLGILSIAFRALVMPSATVSGLFFGIAGVRHLLRRGKTSAQLVATVSDLFLFGVLFAYVVLVQARR